MSQPAAGPEAPEAGVDIPEAVEVKKRGTKEKKIKLPEADAEGGVEVPSTSAAADQPREERASPAARRNPPFVEMIDDAIKALKERSGSSRQAILKYIIEHYSVDPKVADAQVKRALRSGVSSGRFIQAKGTGASGSFKISKEHSQEVKKSPKKTPPKSAPNKEGPKASAPKKDKKSAVKKAKVSSNKKPIKQPMNAAKKPTPKKSTVKPKART